MTIEEKRAKGREYYHNNREKILSRITREQRDLYNARKREWRKNNHELALARDKKYRDERNDEAYRAERRAKYAAKHANDPMTEHRRRCIEASNKRMQIPLEVRRRHKELLKQKN